MQTQTDGGHRKIETETQSERSDRLDWGKRAERIVGPQRGVLTGGN